MFKHRSCETDGFAGMLDIKVEAKIMLTLNISFHVSSRDSSRLYWREHAHVASQLSTRYQTASIKQETSKDKPIEKKISTLYFLC